MNCTSCFKIQTISTRGKLRKAPRTNWTSDIITTKRWGRWGRFLLLFCCCLVSMKWCNPLTYWPFKNNNTYIYLKWSVLLMKGELWFINCSLKWEALHANSPTSDWQIWMTAWSKNQALARKQTFSQIFTSVYELPCESLAVSLTTIMQQCLH